MTGALRDLTRSRLVYVAPDFGETGEYSDAMVRAALPYFRDTIELRYSRVGAGGIKRWRDAVRRAVGGADHAVVHCELGPDTPVPYWCLSLPKFITVTSTLHRAPHPQPWAVRALWPIIGHRITNGRTVFARSEADGALIRRSWPSATVIVSRVRVSEPPHADVVIEDFLDVWRRS